METEDTSKLETSEIVERFLRGVDPRSYVHDFMQRADVEYEIRNYVDKCDLSQTSLINCFSLLDFAKSEAVCELLDNLLCAWSASFAHMETRTRLATSGVTYLAEIAHTVSCEHKCRFGSFDTHGQGDWMLIERLHGAQHLSFLAKHLNRQFEDPARIEQWDRAFQSCFSKRNSPQDAPIAALFCRSMLESEDDDPQIPFYTTECDELYFKLSIPVLRFICRNGISAIRYDLWSEDLIGQSEFRLTLHNIVKTIVAHRFYRDFNEIDLGYFKDALVLYLCYGFSAEMHHMFKTAGEEFVRLVIAAWNEVLERDKKIAAAEQRRISLGWAAHLEAPQVLRVAGRDIRGDLPQIREFLLFARSMG